MSLIIAVLIAYFFLDGAWRLLIIVPAVAIEAAEIWMWLRWRKVGSITGAESMIGAPGVAVSDLDPEGQVKVKGQLWRAKAPERVAAGAAIEVSAVNGLRLEVTRK